MWALLQLEHAVYAPLGSLLIGSQLNTAATDTACRIAFYAKAVQTLPAEKEAVPEGVLQRFKELLGAYLEVGAGEGGEV